MNIRILATVSILLLATATSGFANETLPAWQEPGFVMEEIVVTAPSTAILEITRQAIPAPSRILRALHLHRLVLKQLRTATDAGDGL